MLVNVPSNVLVLNDEHSCMHYLCHKDIVLEFPVSYVGVILVYTLPKQGAL